MTWTRHFQTVQGRPTKKYPFTEALKKIGDTVIFYDLTDLERVRVQTAAKYWAWSHKVRIKTWSAPTAPGVYMTQVTLISYTRKK